MMRMNGPVLMLCAVALAACAGQVPDSNPDRAQGVGLDDYSTYRRAADPVAPMGEVPDAATPLVADAAGSEPEDIAGAAMAALGAAPETPVPAAPAAPAAPRPAATIAAAPVATAPLSAVSPPPVTAQPLAAPVSGSGTRGLSDEQDFEAVSSRETIESDAERLARQRAAYEFVTPTEVPERSGASGPNIVQYALTSRNAVGQRAYSRGPFGGESRAARICARYPSDDLAQEAFLEAGGPDRDRLGVDPDGDGFACGWDPAPFRRAASTARN